jgi:Zn-dependent protease
MNKRLKSALVHSALFVVTFITTTMAGAWWVSGWSPFYVGEDGWYMSWEYLWEGMATGLPYSITFLLILTVHEFGHYFTAVYYRIRTTLPYYIPLPPLQYMWGTLGAVIRIKSRIYSKKQTFDVGIAGPLAGFVMAIVLLIYGFRTLPEPGYIYQLHPEYEQYGENYADYVYARPYLEQLRIPDVIIGNNLLFWFFENYVADPGRVPNHHELQHFPIIYAAFLSLVFTGLNLLPIGQLDGGHVLYGLVGSKRHRIIASIIFIAFLFYSTLGMLRPGESLDVLGFFTAPHFAAIGIMIGLLYFCLKGLRVSPMTTLMFAVGIFTVQYTITWFFPKAVGYSGWLLFVMIVGRVMPVQHPPTEIEEPLTTARKILGWVSLVVFVITWTPNPIEVIF